MFSAITKCSTKPGLLALLLVVAGEVAAQAPHHVLALTPSSVHAFAQEHEMDLQALDAFAGSKRRNGKSSATVVKPERWMLFGRAGPMRFTNQFDAVGDTQFSLRGNSQGLQGKLYVGIHRRF